MSDKNTPSNRLVKIFAGVAIFFLAGVLVLTLGRVLNLDDVLQRPRADGLYCADGSVCNLGEYCADSGYCEKKAPGGGSCGSKIYCGGGVECDPGTVCDGKCCQDTPSTNSKGCDPDATDRNDCVNGSFCSNGQWVCKANNCDPNSPDRFDCVNGAQCLNGQWKCVDHVNSPTPTPKPGGSGGDDGGGNDGGGGTGGRPAPVVNRAGCNAQSPGCVWSCYQKVGNCSGCINYNAKGCTGPLPGGGTTKGNNAACYDSCFSKTGNGSGCKAACDASPTCFNKCVKDGKAPKSCIVPCAMGTYLTPTPVPGGTEVVCQGNVNAPAKCFSCLKDVGGDQLNILDFSCFRNKYGKEVGK